MAFSAVWLTGLPGDWVLDDFSLLHLPFPSLLKPRPLSQLTFWLNLQISGPEPWAFRFTNILLHGLAVQFCYRALRKLLGDSRAFVAAGIFAVHPMQADAVLYIFSRPVVLMGLLLWIALERWLAGKHWWAVFFYSLALSAKEEAVSFPLVLAALHFSISRNVREWRPIAAMVVLALGVVAGVAIATQTLTGSGAGTQAGLTWWQYLAAQPAVIAFYLKQALFPQFMGLRLYFEPLPLWGALLWLVPVIALMLARKHFERAGGAFLAFAALLFLLPTSSVFPIADIAAARRMYLPLALIWSIPAWKWQWGIVATTLYASLTAGVATSYYKDPQAGWLETMKLNPERVEPLLQYCKYVPPSAALKYLMQSPAKEHSGYHTELGRVYLELRQPEQALRSFGKALALDPASASNVYNRGVALAALGQQTAAEADFKRALEIDPMHQPAAEALATLRK